MCEPAVPILMSIEDKICVEKKRKRARAQCGQARTILCIEVEKESTSGFELRNVVEHFPLSIVEDKICVGRGQAKTSTSATHTCGQARTTLCIEVEKEATTKKCC